MSRCFDHVAQPFQSGEAVPESVLVEWEAAAGLRLPADYRRFLLLCNGGCIRPFAFRSPSAALTGADAHDAVNYLYEWREVMKRSQGRLAPSLRNVPPGRLAIGSTECKLAIMLSLDERRFGAIDLWPMTLFHTWGEFPNTVVVPLANSFGAFIDLLNDVDDVHHHVWEEGGAGQPGVRQVMLP